jgi:hypothetical protein
MTRVSQQIKNYLCGREVALTNYQKCFARVLLRRPGVVRMVSVSSEAILSARSGSASTLNGLALRSRSETSASAKKRNSERNWRRYVADQVGFSGSKRL